MWLHKVCKPNDPLYYGKGPAKAVSGSKHQRRFYEIGIPVGQDLYVMGNARERKDIVAPEIAADPHRQPGNRRVINIRSHPINGWRAVLCPLVASVAARTE